MSSTRERQLQDVIDIAAVYLQKKMLSKPDEGDDRSLEEAANELSIVSMIPIAAAKRVLLLLPIREVPGLRTYFREHSRFPIFSSKYFCVADYGEPRGDCEVLEVEFLHILCTGGMSRTASLPKMVQVIPPRIRERLVLFFFQIVGVLATISGWIRTEHLTVSRLQDILRRFLCVSWNTSGMNQDEDDFSWKNMTTGWQIAQKSILSKLRVGDNASNDGNLIGSSLGEEEALLSDIAGDAVVELLQCAYCLLFNKTPITSRKYISSISPLAKEVFRKLCKETVHSLGEDALKESVNAFEKTMSDSLQRIHPPRYVMSTVTETVSTEENLPTHVPETPADHLPEDNPETPKEAIEEEVPGTPPPEVPQCPQERRRIKLSTIAKKVKRRLEAIRTDKSSDGLCSNKEDRAGPMRIDELSGARMLPDDPAPQETEVLDSLDPWLTETGFSALQGGLEGKVSPQMLEDTAKAPAQNILQEAILVDDEGDPHGQRQLENDYQRFMAEMLTWTIDPENCSMANLIHGNEKWFKWYASQNVNNILDNATHTTDDSSFANHWKCIMTMELRGQMSNSLNEKWPKISLSRQDFDESLHSLASPFFVLWVNKVSRSRLVTTLSCDSTDVNLNDSNVTEMSGMSVAVGYLKSLSGRRSPLMLVLIRRVHVERDDRDAVGLSGKVDKIVLSAAIGRAMGDSFYVETGHGLHIHSFYSFASISRMFIAAHRVYKLPDGVKDVLFGPGKRQIFPEQVKLNGSHDVRPLYRSVDPHCLRYLCDLSARKQLNIHQYESLVIALSQIGGAEQDTSSMTMIQGPPGTGKTTCIVNLIGALLHHSKYGHVDESDRHNLLKKQDGILRCSRKPGALKILVTAGSNQAVDNVLRKLKAGVPDGNGGYIKVQAVRIARKGYKFNDVSDYSLNEKSLPFDHEHFNKPPPDAPSDSTSRTSASSRARKALADEAIVFFTTNSLAGSAAFLDLKQEFDIIISDEVSMLLEPESLIPMTSTRSRNRMKRLHYIGVGDPKQLTAVSNTSQILRKKQVCLHFDYDEQTLSQFERLYNAERVAVSFLVTQYRMHNAISTPHSRCFYRAAIKDGLPQASFRTVYNQRASNGTGFYPLTFVDTSFCRSRRETNSGDGKISNFFEAKEVRRVILTICSLVGQNSESSSSSDLKGKIAVIAPYREQVEKVTELLAVQLMENLDIIVDTVDSMQGAEREIIIFTGTRSNDTASVGFLTNRRRLNVAVSRARNLLVIIGDAEHLYGIPPFHFFIDWCRDTRNGSGFIRVHPERGNEIAQPMTRGGSMLLYRRKSEYGLRPRGRISKAKPSWMDRFQST